ncbi:hypothetical protein ACIRLA_34885 [Streptomyces sp. NPDC102364]|uniref:hypothetical protein n=1 Tax=Streptomyces sp. NPDC102364 TaxID=3366161 RepID=UPI0038067298
MKGLTVSAHVEPDSTSRLVVFDNFVIVRVGGRDVEITLLATPGTSAVLRDLARTANEAAEVLDKLADCSTDSDV